MTGEPAMLDHRTSRPSSQVAAPAFAGTGEAVGSLLSRMTVTRPRTPALPPDRSVCTPGLSSTGHRQNIMAPEGGDKHW